MLLDFKKLSVGKVSLRFRCGVLTQNDGRSPCPEYPPE
jgi:hypothetical protein